MGGPEGISIEQLIMAGGPLLGPLLICSILALTIIISKLMYFRSIQADVYQLKSKIFQLIKDNKIKEAVEYCSTAEVPVARILKTGILKFGCRRDEIKEAMEATSLFEIPKMERHLTALGTIANIAPLLGLLGTTLGLITVFHTIQVRAASMSPVTPGDLAGGIWQALLATVAGLVVAIPTFVAYNYCVSRVNAFVLEMERTATELVNFLCHISESGNTSTDE